MRSYLFFFSALILLSCNSNSDNDKNNNVYIPSEDDYKIINSTFVHLTIPAPVTLEGIEREFGYDNFLYDEKDLPKDGRYKIYFTQYLVTLDSLERHRKLRISEERLLKLDDIEFRNLGKEFSLKKNFSVKLDVERINNIGDYKLIPVDINQSVKRKFGEKIITYSRIIYNQGKDKACLYFQNNCVGMCGFGKFVFLNKVNGIWEIKNELYDSQD
ncbi:hypothetical protein [Flammeovirga sp. OC4]|uniref:hypothetical protein n=1 Tax=Flammeovirga sp. OC4 TaxID=1382345 RepID=UPI0005C58C6E|nr:hypothetical protein [Flammeovirga sp. OC4]